ncbi:MAG: hypothetical protein R3D98_05270 [Candidatus Krumholzibacteriia bacterium]
MSVPEPVIDGMVYIGDIQPVAPGLVCFMFQRKRRQDGSTEQYDALVACDAEGHRLATYRDRQFVRSLDDCDYFENDPGGMAAWTWCVDSENRLIVSPFFDSYDLEVYAEDGSLTHVIHRTYESRVRPESYRNQLQEYFDQMYSGKTRRGRPITYTVSDIDRDIQAVFPRPHGSLWVLSSRGAFDTPEGVLVTFDEFDAGGHLVKTVSLVGEGNYLDDDVLIRGDYLFVIKDFGAATYGSQGSDIDLDGEEDQALSVICYRIGSS